MCLACVGQMSKAQVVEQVVRQPDLVARALELPKILETEKLLHDELPLLQSSVESSRGVLPMPFPIDGADAFGSAPRAKPFELNVHAPRERDQIRPGRLARLGTRVVR